MKAEEAIKITFILMSGFSLTRAGLSLDTAEIRVLDQSMGNCKVTVIPTVPKSIDLDVNALADAKDILLQFGAFSFIDGKYNEVIESDRVSVCNMSNSDNPLVQLVFKEMNKVGNLTKACPVVKGHYYVHGLSIMESDVPMPLPSGKFKLEVNGTTEKYDGKIVPLFELDIFFTETV